MAALLEEHLDGLCAVIWTRNVFELVVCMCVREGLIFGLGGAHTVAGV